jgi:hypothetical protein
MYKILPYIVFDFLWKLFMPRCWSLALGGLTHENINAPWMALPKGIQHVAAQIYVMKKDITQ